jgi:hypothetical protein
MVSVLVRCVKSESTHLKYSFLSACLFEIIFTLFIKVHQTLTFENWNCGFSNGGKGYGMITQGILGSSLHRSVQLQPYVSIRTNLEILLLAVQSLCLALARGSVLRKASTYTQDNTNRINAHRRHLCFERAKTVRASDRAATLIGNVRGMHSAIWCFSTTLLKEMYTLQLRVHSASWVQLRRYLEENVAAPV